MSRRYRLTWNDNPATATECTHTALAEANQDDDLVASAYLLGLGGSLTTGGGAAPTVTITCISED